MKTFTKAILSIVLLVMPFMGIIVKAQNEETKRIWIGQDLYFTGNTIGVQKIEVVDKDNLWVLTYDSITKEPTTAFAVSADGGETWTNGDMAIDADYLPYDIAAINASSAWIIAINDLDNAKIYKTTDAGSIWVEQTSVSFDATTGLPVAIRMFDESIGFCVTENISIFRTIDGGTTWSLLTSDVPELETDEKVVRMERATETIGNNAFFGTTKGRFFKSTDKGETWDVVAVVVGDGDKVITQISFADSNNGSILLSSGSSYRTTNAGTGWSSLVNASVLDQMVSVKGTGGIPYVFLGFRNIDDENESSFSIKSLDARGATWKKIDSTFNYTYIKMINDTIGWVGGFSSSTGEPAIFRVPDLPYFTNPTFAVSINDDENFEFVVEAEDINELSLKYSYTIYEKDRFWSSIELVDNLDGTLSVNGTPTNVTTSTSVLARIQVVVENGFRELRKDLEVTINTTNTAPVFVSNGITTAYTNQPYRYEIIVEDADTHDEITFVADVKQNWLALINEGTRVENGKAVAYAVLTGAASEPGRMYIKISAKDRFYTTTQEFFVDIEAYNKVEDFGYGTVSVYPNPTSEYLKINNCQGINYEVFDITGKLVKQGVIKESIETIDVSNLSSGNLLFRLVDGNNAYTAKIVKE